MQYFHIRIEKGGERTVFFFPFVGKEGRDIFSQALQNEGKKRGKKKKGGGSTKVFTFLVGRKKKNQRKKKRGLTLVVRGGGDRSSPPNFERREKRERVFITLTALGIPGGKKGDTVIAHEGKRSQRVGFYASQSRVGKGKCGPLFSLKRRGAECWSTRRNISSAARKEDGGNLFSNSFRREKREETSWSRRARNVGLEGK